MTKITKLPNYGGSVKVEVERSSSEVYHVLSSFRIAPREGAFGLLNEDTWEVNNFYYCREVFQNRSNRIKRMVYNHKGYRTHNIAAFFNKIEDRLNLKNKCIFYTTQYKYVTAIEMTPFWANCGIRRSFFTMMLRVSGKYILSKDNFNDVIYKEGYCGCGSVPLSIKRFLNGNTKYTDKKPNYGWYSVFYDPTVEINKLLVKPKAKWIHNNHG